MYRRPRILSYPATVSMHRMQATWSSLTAYPLAEANIMQVLAGGMATHQFYMRSFLLWFEFHTRGIMQ